MKKRILVCGATGFLGKSAYERLKTNSDYEVTGVSHKGSERNSETRERYGFIPTDLTDKKDIEKIVEGKDVVVQMAAVSTNSKDVIDRPYLHITNNVIMNTLLLRSCFDHGVKNFVFPSCAVVYYPSNRPHKETDPIRPHKRYFGGGHMKAYIEKQCQFYETLGRTKHVMFRHSNVYGPNDKFDLEKSHVLASMIIKTFNSLKSGEIPIWGEGKEKRDFIYIDDLMDFLELAIEDNLSGIFNVGSGEQISIAELGKKIRDKVNPNARIKYDTSKPSLNFSWSVDSSKANSAGWEQGIGLDEGLDRTIEHYKECLLLH